MDIRLLGRLECFDDAGPIAIPGTSARAVLALFALRPNEVVLTDEIIDGLWGAKFPLDPTAAVRVTVSRLRRALGKERTRVRSVAHGYVLDLDPADVDIGRAQVSLELGRSLLDKDRPRQAVDVLGSALAEWRHDPPLAEFADLPFTATVTSRLHLLRSEIVETANEAALRSGRPEEVVARTERLLDADPWRETLVSQLMVALYQLGRQAEALVAYSEFASRLRADFGADPSPALTDTRSRVMSHDPTLRPRSARAVSDTDVLPSWFQSVLDDLGEEAEDPELRCRLRLALGEAQHHAGLPGWQDTLLDAAERAKSIGDSAMVARCALAGALGWSVTPGKADDRRLSLLTLALEDEASADDELRARLLAAYANELSFTAALEERMRYSDQAIALARSSGKPALLLSILNQRFNAIWAPETLETRLRNSQEASLIAEAGEQLLAEEVAAGFAMAASLEAGDMEGTDRHLDRFIAVAGDLGLPVFLWGAKLHASWRAVIAGNLEDAELLCATALRLGTVACRPEAQLVHLSQRAAIRWAQGRLAEEAPSLGRLCHALPALPGFQASHALAVFSAGDVAGARGLLIRAWAEGSIERLPHDQLYLAALMLWGELATALGDAVVGERLFAMLEPHRDRFCFTGAAVYGPVAHALGLLAGMTERRSVALDHLGFAADLSRKMQSSFFAERSERAIGSTTLR